MEISYLKSKKFWDNHDLQNSLDYLQENETERNKIIAEIEKHEDYDLYALLVCIKVGDAERFDRFDSDVAEKYINYFKDLFL